MINEARIKNNKFALLIAHEKVLFVVNLSFFNGYH